RQSLRRSPPDPQSGEAPGSVPDHDAFEIGQPHASLLEGVIDQHDDFGRVAARALNEHPRVGAWRLSHGDARDIRRRVDRQPARTHQRISSSSRTSAPPPWESRKWRSSAGAQGTASSGHSNCTVDRSRVMSSDPMSRSAYRELRKYGYVGP